MIEHSIVVTVSQQFFDMKILTTVSAELSWSHSQLLHKETLKAKLDKALKIKTDASGFPENVRRPSIPNPNCIVLENLAKVKA